MRPTARGFCAVLFTTVLSISALPAVAACQAHSGNTTVALLELYTSEGCSSCPPADHWVAQLPQHGFHKNRVVPLAFHVDYWNYLGWVDPFAQSIFTQRQREFARLTDAATVYTPELVLSGREYRRWWGNSFESAVERINDVSPRADIRLALKHSGKTLRIDTHASARAPNADAASLYVALYESNLTRKIEAGENSGRTLHHAFVVRRLYGPFTLGEGGTARFERTLALDPGWKEKDLGVAAFVQQARGTHILQTLALDVCS